jgi:minor histocompatibility antigen H13
MMVTVAKSLDVPIKLMFPRPAPANDSSAGPSHAMLGLGDIVLPGIMIGLALRFDLHLFYLRRQKRIPAAEAGEEDTVEKPQYHSLAGRWSDHFWTHSLAGRPLWVPTTTSDSKPEAPFTFPKTYFTASLVGYVLGLLTTLGVMMVWNHAQPALLYLVPGVLGSIWLTALARGELDLMWNFTEDIADDDSKDKAEEKIQAIDEKKNAKSTQIAPPGEFADGLKRSLKRIEPRRPEREIFSFSIEAPWKLKETGSLQKEYKGAEASKHKWVPSKSALRAPDAEPAGKRVRLN